MDYKTRNQIIRDYEVPQEIKDFLKKHPIKAGKQYQDWYSENGKLKIK